MDWGERLREQRERAGLSLGQVAEYEHVSRQYLSKLEVGTNEPPTWELLARLATRYRTTTDYLLGLTEDPSPRRGEPLPAPVRELVELAQDMSPTRQQELLAHAHVLADAELQADLREYDRMMALILALPEGDILRESVEEALRTGASGDTAAALRIIDAYIAGRAAKSEPHEEQVEQA